MARFTTAVDEDGQGDNAGGEEVDRLASIGSTSTLAKKASSSTGCPA